MTRAPQSILVTGGAGFIGSSVIRHLFNTPAFTGKVVNLDVLTYAGNPKNLAGHVDESRYAFVREDICDADRVRSVLAEHEVDCIIHLAAESHVDRSIHGPEAFVRTNVLGTFVLLEAARHHGGVHFHHVSTDEVYGSLGAEGLFREDTAYDPRSPYRASKASSDHLVSAYHHTYGLSTTVSNCSNNYGPYQFPEKLVPLMILNALEGKPLPVYGDGSNIRDWLHVDDHSEAVWRVVTEGRSGETYNVGANNEWTNLDLLHELLSTVSRVAGRDLEELKGLITFVKDRPGHDQRYAIDSSKIETELGYQAKHSFSEGLAQTVRWYLDNSAWVDDVRSGAYKEWIEDNYGER